QFEYLVHPPARDLVRSGHPAQVSARGTVRMHPARLHQGSDLPERVLEFLVPATPDRDRARGRIVQAEHHAHGGGLSRRVRAEETGDRTRLYAERQVVDSQCVAVPFREALRLDHVSSCVATSVVIPGLIPASRMSAVGRVIRRGQSGALLRYDSATSEVAGTISDRPE